MAIYILSKKYQTKWSITCDLCKRHWNIDIHTCLLDSTFLCPHLPSGNTCYIENISFWVSALIWYIQIENMQLLRDHLIDLVNVCREFVLAWLKEQDLGCYLLLLVNLSWHGWKNKIYGVISSCWWICPGMVERTRSRVLSPLVGEFVLAWLKEQDLGCYLLLLVNLSWHGWMNKI
jgi:hypothetical protein